VSLLLVPKLATTARAVVWRLLYAWLWDEAGESLGGDAAKDAGAEHEADKGGEFELECTEALGDLLRGERAFFRVLVEHCFNLGAGGVGEASQVWHWSLSLGGEK
jgi:hypothetical protein